MTLDEVIERFDGSLAYSTNSKEICQYIADLLKELKERRKAPEIIRCGECKYLRRWISANHQFCDITACKVSEDEFCNRAERRTE